MSVSRVIGSFIKLPVRMVKKKLTPSHDFRKQKKYSALTKKKKTQKLLESKNCAVNKCTKQLSIY